jgi:pimeloyl-ACP methyl ester carboxylesterase
MVLSTRIEHGNGLIEEAVTMASTSGALRGVLARGQRKTGVLLLHGWGGGRCGPHDLLTTLAREISAAGWPSLRFDFSDRGESDGMTAGVNLDQMGEDALAAAAVLRESTGCDQIVMLGICSGGNVAIGILDRLPECCGLLLLSVYPFSEGDSFGRRSKRTASAAKDYARKAFRLETWRKLFRGAIDFGAIRQVLFGHHQGNEAQTSAKEAAGQSPLDNLRLRPFVIDMIYGEADPDTEASLRYYREYADTHNLNVDFTVLPDADHNYYSLAHTANLKQAALHFLERVN